MKKEIILVTLSVFISITIMSGISYVFSWQEPQAIMPSNYVVPINTTSSAQTKSGELSATLFRDANNSSYYINPSGNSVVSGTISASNPTASNHLATKNYVDSKVDNTFEFLGINYHTGQDCIDVGGTIWETPEGINICRITSPNVNDTALDPCGYYNYSTATAVSCPSGWQQYRNWSTTGSVWYTSLYCQTHGCWTKITGAHGWADKAVEVSSYDPCAYCQVKYCYTNTYAKIIEIGCY